MSVARTLMALVVITLMVAVQACDRTVTSVVSSDEPLSCGECHDPSNLITGKRTQWEESLHGTGTAYTRGTRASCAGCHSGNGFAERVAMGLDPDEVAAGDPDPTRQDCRACHMIHETYTMEDFELKTEAPVVLYAVEGAIFDGGEGNLCVNCHQPRRVYPGADSTGMVTGITSHWGPHHGPQSAMILGVAGAGVTGRAHGHYGAVANTCVGCHMGEGRDHHFEPELDTCRDCHPDATSFDYHGVQSLVDSLTFELGELLVQAGLINENSEDGHPIVEEAPEDQAIALYNWIYVSHEDKSHGVHNADYATALLKEGLARMTAPGPAAP